LTITKQSENKRNCNTRNISELHQERIEPDRCNIFSNYWGIKMFNCLSDDLKAREEKEFRKEIKNVLIRMAYYSI